MKKAIAVALALMAAPGAVSAACESGHWIEDVSSSGRVITLEDESIWKVLGGDEVYSSLWLPTESVLVCPDGTIINTDVDGEQVSVKLLSR